MYKPLKSLVSHTFLFLFAGCSSPTPQSYTYKPNDTQAHHGTLEVIVESIHLGENLSMSMVGPNSHFTGWVVQSDGLSHPPQRIRVHFDRHTGVNPKESERLTLMLSSTDEVFRIDATGTSDATP